MKKVYMLAASLVLVAGAFAQSNLNLEQWENNDPVGWETLNVAGLWGTCTFQDSDAAEGDYAARVETIYYEDCSLCPLWGFPEEGLLAGIMLQEFEVPGNNIPLNFSFSVKYELGATGDEGLVALQAWNWNAAAGEREYVGQAIYSTAANVATWSAQSLALQWADAASSPDSMEILVIASASQAGLPGSTASEGSKIWVDDFVITYEQGEEPVSVNEVEANDIKAYPNPATDVLNIELNENIASVSLVGMDGRVVYSSEVSSTTATIDVASLQSGVYYYVVVTETGKTARNSFVKK